MKTCKDCGIEVKGRAKRCVPCKEAKKLAKDTEADIINQDVEKQDEGDTPDVTETVEETPKKGLTKRVLKPTMLDVVPRLGVYPKVNLYAFAIGVRGYRFSINPPTHSKPVWQQTMTGVQAEQFLRGVKKSNKGGRLESLTLPKQ